MPYCTVVEFAWDESFDHSGFRATISSLGGTDELPTGCLSRIVGIDGNGARMIDVWRSDADAREFAERSAPMLSKVALPAPSRVFSFEVATYLVA
jgi:hypothetical protein